MFLARFTLLVVFVLAGCGGGGTGRVPGGVRVLATTSTLASLAVGVLGDPARVRSLVPVGASPEDYQPAPQDIEAVHDADVLLENGANLETWLDGTIQNARNPHLQLVVLSAGLPVRDGNPHLWMDPVFARAYVRKVRDALVQADPANAATYRANAAAYDAKLRALVLRTQRKIATIPSAQRVMIVFHNAFDYYDARFGLTTLGVVEINPGADPSPQHLAQIVELARANHVRAVFAEPEYSPKLIQALAESAGIKTISNLYDDSVGTDPKVDTYIGMIDYDTDTIVGALK
ncbi:MAG: metal ABC transporter substrate-binding protein [Candidatus Velthaea sp.]|jgi:ABC-type Zn uptake system ZnuABC Zn-binding protein ZnuA